MDETLKKKRSVSSEGPSQEDSGIDLSSNDPAPESDTEMTDLMRGGESEGIISDQPLLMAESDLDTDGESSHCRQLDQWICVFLDFCVPYHLVLNTC